MGFLRTRIPAIIAAALLALTQLSCGKSVVRPIDPPAEQLPFEWSFERDGVPTLEGWRAGNPWLTRLVRDSGPGGGEWALGLEADWAPTTGFVIRPMPGVRNGDFLELSAFVRGVGEWGGGSITLLVGPSLLRETRAKTARSGSSSWTLLSIRDTVSLAPADSVWVMLSSLHTEIERRQGYFDLVALKRIGSVTSPRE